MPTLTITPSYSNGTVLTAAQLDTLVDPITTLLNTTTLDSVNIDISDVVSNVSSSEAGIVLNKTGLGNIVSDTETLTSLTTTWVSATSVTAPTAGDYLINVFGTVNIRETTTTSSTTWAGYVYIRLYSSTTTTAIGPEAVIGNAIAITGGANTLNDRSQAYGFGLSYITTLSASQIVEFQGYRDTDFGVSDSNLANMYMQLLRLTQ